MPRAPRRCAGSFAELMARNADNRKAPPFFWKRFKIRLDEDLNGITAGVNFDANGRIAKINFVTAVSGKGTPSPRLAPRGDGAPPARLREVVSPVMV